MTRIKPASGSHGVRRRLAAAIVGCLAAAPGWSAPAEADRFQQAVNYVFTGAVDPPNAPKIVDRKECVVVMHDPKYNRYIRYHLRRFQMETALFAQKYAGSQSYYELDVKGSGVILEYLSPDQASVAQAYRSAQISLPGEIDQTQKALKILFSDYCQASKPQAPF